MVDDFVQEVFLKLAQSDQRLLKNFIPRDPDSFLGFVSVVAGNVVHDNFRAANATKRGAAVMEADATIDSNLSGVPQVSSVERVVLMREIDDCVRTVTVGPQQSRDIALFNFYYRQGLTAQAIAEIKPMGLTVKGVESALLRITRAVRERLRTLGGPDPQGKTAADTL
jgi:DNA-directed RNA polymerase specialized sigma24 family protein